MLEQGVLGEIGVLELIHQHVLEAPGILFAHGREFGEQVGRPQKQVVEIHGVVLFQ